MNTRHTRPLAVLTSLFFMWGLITSLNDILIPHLKAMFSLSYVQASPTAHREAETAKAHRG